MSAPDEVPLDLSSAENRVLSLTRARSVYKTWAAPHYVVIWFDGPGRTRLTVEHVDAIRGSLLIEAGWRRMGGGRYRRTVKLHDLAAQLELIGQIYATEIA
ncbi:MAG: hypothetical protein HS111_00785 [Kofleriaceae bacterium]|nr:hypothetical protein [Kofleriaceae bacterium]